MRWHVRIANVLPNELAYVGQRVGLEAVQLQYGLYGFITCQNGLYLFYCLNFGRSDDLLTVALPLAVILAICFCCRFRSHVKLHSLSRVIGKSLLTQKR